MDHSINSSNLFKEIFSFLNEKVKLDLVRYNKRIQKKLDITLINYINFSGKYVIIEKSGKGKEYDADFCIIFEGEYLNGKRNGIGKEYNSIYDKVIFEGEYLNGKRNGKGKEYDRYGYITFEGEYLNGKKWNGKGEYDDYIYEIKNGKGMVREFISCTDEIIFEGEYLNGKKMGMEKNMMVMVMFYLKVSI